MPSEMGAAELHEKTHPRQQAPPGHGKVDGTPGSTPSELRKSQNPQGPGAQAQAPWGAFFLPCPSARGCRHGAPAQAGHNRPPCELGHARRAPRAKPLKCP